MGPSPLNTEGGTSHFCHLLIAQNVHLLTEYVDEGMVLLPWDAERLSE